MGDGVNAFPGVHRVSPPPIFNPKAIVAGPEYGMVYDAPFGQNIELRVSNIMPVPLYHPWHLHGHKVAILARGSLPYNPDTVVRREYPIWRDTFFVGPFEWVLVQFKADNPGLWMLHCHLDLHFAMGFTVLIKEAADRITLPKNFPTCDNYNPQGNAPQGNAPHHGLAIAGTSDALFSQGMAAMMKAEGESEIYSEGTELNHPGLRQCAAPESINHRVSMESMKKSHSQVIAAVVSVALLGNIAAVVMLYRRQNRLLAERSPLVKN